VCDEGRQERRRALQPVRAVWRVVGPGRQHAPDEGGHHGAARGAQQRRQSLPPPAAPRLVRQRHGGVTGPEAPRGIWRRWRLLPALPRDADGPGQSRCRHLGSDGQHRRQRASHRWRLLLLLLLLLLEHSSQKRCRGLEEDGGGFVKPRLGRAQPAAGLEQRHAVEECRRKALNGEGHRGKRGPHRAVAVGALDQQAGNARGRRRGVEVGGGRERAGGAGLGRRHRRAREQLGRVGRRQALGDARRAAGQRPQRAQSVAGRGAVARTRRVPQQPRHGLGWRRPSLAVPGGGP
jgi:hypothetical protein